MKKLLVIILILILAVAVFIKPANNEEIVLSIQANSSSIEDAYIMDSINNVINKYISSLTNNCDSGKSAFNIIKENKQNIENIVNSSLKQLKTSYKAIIVTKQCNMPLTNIDGYTLKQGLYNSLQILLGNSEGDSANSVIYPSITKSNTKHYKSRFIK